MNREHYLKNRHDIIKCFQIYCHVKDIRPTRTEVFKANSLGISHKKLIEYLDVHFAVSILVKDNKIVKIF